MMLRRMRDFVVAGEMDHGGILLAVAVVFSNASAASLPGMPL